MHRILALLLLIAACGSERTGTRIVSRCVPGRSEACTCSDGRLGSQICDDENNFGPCTCEGPPPSPDATVTIEDAQPHDTGPAEDDDAGVVVPDAGFEDARAPDAFAPDAISPVDTGAPDLGTPDTGARDTGVRDTGAVDTGVPGVCVSDTECSPPSTICEGGACVPSCFTGGPPCTSGTCNPFTGRCGGGFCIFDSMCAPPNTICENNTCVSSCIIAGCASGDVCDNSTGRCIPACVNDSQCAPPDTICISGGCRPGCGQFGGLTCSGPDVCNTMTGRCGPCTSDAQCGAPSSVCIAGACTPGCAEPGGISCSAGTICQHDTGRCEAPGSAALGAACMRHNDCASSFCHAFQGGSEYCVTACGTNRDCPSGFSCVDDGGARVCVAAARVSGSTFVDPAGAMCTTNGECQSNLCSMSACLDTCAEDADCPGGTCKWYSPVTNDFITACNGPLGTVANGGACTTNGDCRSGVCAGSTCAELCSTTGDCDASRVCIPIDQSVCLQELFPGFCVDWEVNVVPACVVGTRGAGAVGAACTMGSQCQSTICHVGLGRCTDTCSRSADCPASDRCKSVSFNAASGPTTVMANLCVPRGY